MNKQYEEKTRTLYYVRQYGDIYNSCERYFTTLEFAKEWVDKCGGVQAEKHEWINVHSEGWISPSSVKSGWRISTVVQVIGIEVVEYSDPKYNFPRPEPSVLIGSSSIGTSIPRRERKVIDVITSETLPSEDSQP